MFPEEKADGPEWVGVVVEQAELVLLFHIFSINALQMQVASATQKNMKSAPSSMYIYRQKGRVAISPHAPKPN